MICYKEKIKFFLRRQQKTYEISQLLRYLYVANIKATERFYQIFVVFLEKLNFTFKP